MASLHDLARLGQSVWLDFIDRNLVANGGLQRLVDGGLTGVTTNPTIFHKAIGGGRTSGRAWRHILGCMGRRGLPAGLAGGPRRDR